MNILKLQDDLKNFSQQQLVMEMQRPSGNVPQFLVLSELSRRKRMQTDQARAEAANTPTVAQEAVAAAGMPMGGITQMAQAMAPKTSMTENTGIAVMMPKQPTRMATGGVVKMQTAGGVPFYGLEKKVFKGQEYFTDGDTVYKQYESGQLDVVRDPDVVEGILRYSPSASTDVGSLSNVSTNVEDFSPITLSNTTDPAVDRSALDPVLGIRPEMIAQLPDQGNPNFSNDIAMQKAISEIAGIGGNNFVTDVANEAAAENREDSLSTFPVRNQFQDNQPQVDDLGFSSTRKRRKNRDKNEIKEQVDSNISGRNDPPRSDRDNQPQDQEPLLPIQFQDNQPQDREPLLPTEKTPELTPEQKLLQKLEAKSAESTGALMDFYKELEKDKKYEMAMKMVEFGAELMRPTATIGEGAANATKVMMKGARERKKDYNKNKIAILSLQERIDASKAAAARAELGLGIQQANLDLRTQLAAGSAAKAAREKAAADFELLGGIDRLNALKFAIKEGKASPQDKAEYMRLQSMLDKLIPSGTGAKNIEVQDT